jgi:YVTN family beta-propeller protein
MKRLLLLTFAISSLCLAPQAFPQRVLTKIPVGGQPGRLAVNPTTNMIYVPNTTLNTVTVVNASSNQVVTNIAMPSTPIAAAVNSTTNLIYVTTGYPSNSVVVIDGSSNTVTATVPAGIPGFIAVNPVTNLIYFSNTAVSLSVLDGTTNQIVDTITTAYGIQGIAVNQVTNRIYLAESTATLGVQMVVINGSTNKATTFQIPNSCFLTYIAVDSTINRIYVVDNDCSVLYVINGANNKLLTTILPTYTGPMTVNPTNHQITNFGDFPTLLSFVNGRTDKIAASLSFPFKGGGPMTIDAGSSNRYYVAFYKSNDVMVILGPQAGTKRSVKRLP